MLINLFEIGLGPTHDDNDSLLILNLNIFYVIRQVSSDDIVNFRAKA